MADLERVVVAWTGLTGLPGVSVHYGSLGGTLNSTLKTWFTAMQSLFPGGLSWTVPGNGDLIDEVTGDLSGTWVNSGGGGSVAASGATAYAAGCGAYVNWRTGALVGGRRLMGRTFLAPLMNTIYQSNGTIVDANLATLQTACTAVVTAGNMRIWHRPGSVAGIGVAPSAATVVDQVTSLRTRRR